MITTGAPRAAAIAAAEAGSELTCTSPETRALIDGLPARMYISRASSPYFSKRPASFAIQRGTRVGVADVYAMLRASSFFSCAGPELADIKRRRKMNKIIFPAKISVSPIFSPKDCVTTQLSSRANARDLRFLAAPDCVKTPLIVREPHHERV